MATVTVLQTSILPPPAVQGNAASVCEPSLSNAGNNVFFTGNWFAAESADHGSTWTFVDPYYTLPPIDNGFTGDQTSIYIPKVNLTAWLLQYRGTASSNVLRLAVRAPGGVWRYWNFRPTTINTSWTNQWFDFNCAALSDNFLYVTSNMFSSATGAFSRAVVLRFRVTDLLNTAPLAFQSFASTTNGSLRPTLGAKSVMYFGSHDSTSRLRLLSWPETATTPSWQNIGVTRWNNAVGYSAPCADGNDWLPHADGRITAAWTGAGEIGFAWTSNKTSTRPLPFVRVVRIKESTKAVLAEPDIADIAVAYAWPDVCPNVNGVPAISMFKGGGTVFPSHVVGVLDAGAWKLQTVRSGTNAPMDWKWGDYLAIRRHSPDETSWIASGYTQQGGATRANIQPHFVHFRI